MTTATPSLCTKCGNPADHTCVWVNGRAYHVECSPSYDPRSVLCSLRTALSQEREAREKAEKERDEYRRKQYHIEKGRAICYVSKDGKNVTDIYDLPVERMPNGYDYAAELEAAEASLAEAKRLGGMLANAAYNICQRGEVDVVTLRSLNEARQAWDDMPARFLAQEPNHER